MTQEHAEALLLLGELREAAQFVVDWPWEEMDLGERTGYIRRDVERLRRILHSKVDE